jgi:hypothetical protein
MPHAQTYLGQQDARAPAAVILHAVVTVLVSYIFFHTRRNVLVVCFYDVAKLRKIESKTKEIVLFFAEMA